MNIGTLITLFLILIDVIKRLIKPCYIVLVPLVKTENLFFLPEPTLKFKRVSQSNAFNSISLPIRLELMSNRYIAALMKIFNVKGLLLKVKAGKVNVYYSSSTYQSYKGIILSPDNIENPSFDNFTLSFSWMGVKDRFYISPTYEIEYKNKVFFIKDLTMRILLIRLKIRIIKEKSLIIELK